MMFWFEGEKWEALAFVQTTDHTHQKKEDRWENLNQHG